MKSGLPARSYLGAMSLDLRNKGLKWRKVDSVLPLVNGLDLRNKGLKFVVAVTGEPLKICLDLRNKGLKSIGFSNLPDGPDAFRPEE